MLIYNKLNGKIIKALSNDEVIDSYIDYYKDTDMGVISGYFDINIMEHYINNGVVEKYNDIEIFEISKYGKILSSEERLLNEMMPSFKEVKDAEEEIKLLKLLEELI